MRILLINAVCGIRSTGRIVDELATYISGHESEAFIAYGEAKEQHMSANENHLYYIGNMLDHKMHAFFSRITGLPGYYSHVATLRLERYIDRIHPDVVHLHNLHGNYVNIPMLLRFLGKRNIATVITLHDCFMFTGGCMHYTTNQCYQWKDNCRRCRFNDFRMPSWFFNRAHTLFINNKKAYKRIRRLGVIGVSDWITREAKESILNCATYIQRIYNWIDLDVFCPTVTNEKRKKAGLEGKFVVLGVATKWSNAKGLDDFVELSKILDEHYEIVLVGNYEAPQINGITSIGATDSVDTLVEYYSMADVFIQFSQQETFGKVVAEALACGTPVISVNGTANNELIADGCGFLINPHDVIRCKEIIQQIDRLGKLAYSEKCREFAKETFEYSECCDMHIKMYEKLLSSKE